MKRLFISMFALCVLCLWTVTTLSAQSPKTEFRATWFTTHYGIDWPKTKATSSANITKQKKEMTDILDALKAGNMNATCFQARPVADAFYQSSYEPWSHILTGKRGQNPGYDPLAYAVEQAHARGMELHAWVNPFRYEITAGERTSAINNGTALASSDPIRAQHPDWLLTYNNGTFNGTILDPGNPEARAYVVKVLLEIVNNYDIDGMLMDDYFYPYGGTTTEDATSKSLYKPSGMSDGDWRRENVNKVIKAVYDSIQVVKPWVKFGMAPGGIYSMTASAAAAYGLTLPSGISGGDIWKVLYCDALAWIDGGYVDYMAPQVYWSTTAAQQDYDVLCQWWGQSISTLNARRTDGKKVHSYISQACYRFGPDELGLEIDANRQYSPYSAPGSIFYNTNTYLKFTHDGVTDYSCSTLATTRFTQKALPPAVTWKATSPLAAPTGLTLSGTTLSWQHPTAQRFSVYVFPKGTDAVQAMSTSAYLVGMVYGNQADLSGYGNLNNMTVAVCAMDRYGNENEAALYNEGEVPEPEPQVDGELSRIELWRKTVAQTGVMSTNNANRSLAYYDGKLYLSGSYEYYILNATTGILDRTVDISTSYSFCMHNLRITDDGEMLFGNTRAGTTKQYFYYSGLGETNITAVEPWLFAGFGRSDYFYPFGTWNGYGHAVMLSNTEHKWIKILFGNGHVGSPVQMSDYSLLPAGTSAKAIPRDANTFFATAANCLPTIHENINGSLRDQWSGSAKPAAVNVSGIGFFRLGGKEYLLLPTDVYGSFDTYDITNGLTASTKLLTTTNPLGETANGACTIDFAVNVQGNDAYVYVLAPNNGIAAYKYTFTPSSGTALEQNGQPAPPCKQMTPDGLIITVNGHSYTATGIQIE